MPPTSPPAFQVQQLGAGFFPIGNWYWCHVGPDGYPTEPIDSHGPFALKCLAAKAARQATTTGGNA